MYVVKVPKSDKLVGEILRDPEAYVAETRRLARTRAKTRRATILDTISRSAGNRDAELSSEYVGKHGSFA